MTINPLYYEKFENRHNGPDAAQVADMLKTVKASSVDELIDQTVPANIRLKKPLNLPPAQTEQAFLKTFKPWPPKTRCTNPSLAWGIIIIILRG